MTRLRNILVGRRVAVIDADDTLWYNARYYAEFIDRVVDLMVTERMGDCNAARRSLSLQVESADPGERGFADSVIAFVRTSGGSRCFVRQVVELANLFAEHPVKLLPDARLAVRRLPSQIKLLYTKGVEAEQIRKIKASGMKGDFDEVIVTKRKSAEQLSNLLGERGIAGPDVLAIGNSIRHDVVPAVSLGAAAIWFNHPENLYGDNGRLPAEAMQVRGWDAVLDALQLST